MTGSTRQRYSRPDIISHFINYCTYLLYKLFKIFRVEKKVSGNSQPLLITGLFRSGTTITSAIVKDMGFSAGPDEHLLQGIGKRKWLNPGGFLENHFFMELSMYLFDKTNSWGDTPPPKEVIEKVVLEKADDDKMVYFSMVKLHEDRISNLNKLKVQIKGSASRPQDYLNEFFKEKSFIKNPHFSVLFPYFRKIFPHSSVLVVFRHPAEAVRSAKNVTPLADFKLYEKYYSEWCSQLKNGNNGIHFFSYDELVKHPLDSVQKLAVVLGADQIPSASYIKKNEKPEDEETIPDSTMTIYKFMLSNCINVS